MTLPRTRSSRRYNRCTRGQFRTAPAPALVDVVIQCQPGGCVRHPWREMSGVTAVPRQIERMAPAYEISIQHGSMLTDDGCRAES